MKLNELTHAATAKLAMPAMSAASDFELSDGSALDKETLRVGKFLRHLLRMIVAEPEQARAPQQAVQRLRPFVDRARLELQTAGDSEKIEQELARGRAQLLEGAVAGLCHVARFCAGASSDSIIPPFAVAGVDIRTRHPSESSVLDLIFVVPENARAQKDADRMIAFVLTGLADLGFTVSYASCTPGNTAGLGGFLPGFTLVAGHVRFVWGSFSLYERLTQRLPANDPCIPSN
jgi:hypothetical protein